MTSNEFKPTGAPMSTTGGTFIPSNKQPFASMRTTASAFTPSNVNTFVPTPKVVEPPPKDKLTLLVERVIKGSDTDVKADELSEEDQQ